MLGIVADVGVIGMGVADLGEAGVEIVDMGDAGLAAAVFTCKVMSVLVSCFLASSSSSSRMSSSSKDARPNFLWRISYIHA